MRKVLSILSLGMLAMFLVAAVTPGYAGLPGNKQPVLSKPDVVELRYFQPNRIKTDVLNEGQWVSWRRTGDAGMEWPAGSGKTIHFAAGIWIAGMVDGAVRTAAAEFSVEFVPGPIAPDGSIDPDNPRYKLYIISKADVEAATDDDPATQPSDDYLNWPKDLGAPVDENGNPLLIGNGALWTVFNDADPAAHGNLFNTPPIGVEVQMYLWGFNRLDAFGDMLFLKFTIINKGKNDLDSAFVSLWNDFDLGYAADDFVGVDTTLSLGYGWNDGADRVYGSRAPAIGLDFFQGPIVPSPGDTAFVSGRRIPNYKNLPMTSFAKYINGGGLAWGDPESAEEAYNYMNGLNRAGEPYVDPNTGKTLKFAHPGDPVTGEGWIDPQSHPSGDRRFMMTTGPFVLAKSDTQEVVAGFMIAQGGNNLQSISLLRQIDKAAQTAYDRNFELPPPPPAPKVTVSELDGEIVLTWDNAAESYDVADLVGRQTFQGYNVYQIGGPQLTGDVPIVRLATFDIIDGQFDDVRDVVFDPVLGEIEKVVQPLSDSGIRRFYRTTEDQINKKPLINGRKYWFAVTAFGYNPDGFTPSGVPKILESAIKVIEVVPQSAPLTKQFQASTGTVIAEMSPDTTFNVTHEGPGDGGVIVEVVDPTQITGLDYTVVFDSTDQGIVWHLDRSDGKRVLANQTNQNGDLDYLPVDGLLVRVTGPPLAFGSGDGDGIVEVAFNGQPLTPDQYDAAGAPYKGNKVWHSLNHKNDIDRYYVSAGGGGGAISRLMRYIQFAVPRDFELRFTDTGGYGVYAFEDDKIAKVPFELWDIGVGTPDDPSDDFRMIPFLLSWDSTKAEWGWANGTDPAFGFPASDWVYWMDPYETTSPTKSYDDFAAAAEAAGGPGATYPYDANQPHWGYFINRHGGFVYPIGRSIYCDFDGNGTPPPSGTVIRFNTTKPNSPKDRYTFSTKGFEPKTLSTADAAKRAAELVNVFPNPYYGRNKEETDPVNRFVTFTHLPETAKIRIFTLAGKLVKVIDHQGGQFEQWDLRNDAGIPVASGIYIVHIEMGALGQKVLKVAVFMPEERLDAI